MGVVATRAAQQRSTYRQHALYNSGQVTEAAAAAAASSVDVVVITAEQCSTYCQHVLRGHCEQT
jgi:50S ribosomal subunit-associated GTPase HflX